MKRLFLLLALASLTLTSCSSNNPVVVIETSEGTIKAELYQDKAPQTVENFLSYAQKNHYDGTIFHRVISGFMIQGGGFTEDMKEKDSMPPIPNESSNGLQNTRGTLAMARTNDPNSATDQFFINTVDNSSKLDRVPYTPGREGYAVFGKVIEGMDVVDKIQTVATGKKFVEVKPGVKVPFDDVPADPIIIRSIRLLKKK